MEARSRENFLLRQQLQKLTDCAGGLTVAVPRDWSLEQLNTALRLWVRTVSQGEPGCGERVEGVGVGWGKSSKS